MKRAVVLVLVVFSICSVYLLWGQWAQESPLGNPGYMDHVQVDIRPKFRRRSGYPDYTWTWECATDHCERRKWKGHMGNISSQIKCQMSCGPHPLWPEPTDLISLGTNHLTFRIDQLHLELTAAEPAHTLAKSAFDIFKQNLNMMMTSDRIAHNNLSAFNIRIKISDDTGEMLSLDTDESYVLSVQQLRSDLVADVKAKSFFGARHGLETLSQLIWWDEHSSTLRIVQADIRDKPTFKYRGLMVDTSRNFFSVEILKRVIEGMAANKMNVFHWHISDSQSFPFDSPRVPQMAKYGAYSADQIYTASDVQKVVEFARVRGVRVLIEIDMPAHAGNGWTWGPDEGYGDLAVCVNQEPWHIFCGEPPCGQINPANPKVFEIIEKLYRDVLDLTRETEIFHMGGDEVNLHCWEQLTSSLDNGDLHEVWGNFTKRAIETLRVANGGELPSTLIFWSSKLTEPVYLAKYFDRRNTVIQVWGGSDWMETTNILSNGYRAILSHVDAWYLDCGLGKWRESGDEACGPYHTWQKFYRHRPWHKIEATEKVRVKDLILGAEACLWTEKVDEANLETRIWPRVAAFAERLWSDPDNTGKFGPSHLSDAVYTRLAMQRRRLLDRGLSADSLGPEWCMQNPGKCS